MTNERSNDDGREHPARTSADRDDLTTDDPDKVNADPFAEKPTAQGRPDPESFSPNGDADSQPENEPDEESGQH